ncbi:MAG: hypothetical protein M1832_000630 [Thelocarpon impressellum]|nr:MAG: hypothetical protein M1832_000630 [Thelocarpon impressellum]
MFFAASTAALSLSLLGLLHGANALPADALPSMAQSINFPSPTPHVDPLPVVLQVQFIQDGSKRPDVFNQTAPTFVNTWAVADNANDSSELRGDLEMAMHFQYTRGLLYWAAKSEDSTATGVPHSGRMLIADTRNGKLTIASRSGRATDRLWRFDERANLVLISGSDPRMKICRSGVGTPTGNTAADRLLIRLGDALLPEGMYCQNIHLHLMTVPHNNLALTDVEKWAPQLPPNPQS